MKTLPVIVCLLLSAASSHAEVIAVSMPLETKGVYYVFDECTIQYAGGGTYDVKCKPGYFRFDAPALTARPGPKLHMTLNGSVPYEVTLNGAGMLPDGERYYAITMD